jgi:hypothetical protein
MRCVAEPKARSALARRARNRRFSRCMGTENCDSSQLTSRASTGLSSSGGCTSVKDGCVPVPAPRSGSRKWLTRRGRYVMVRERCSPWSPARSTRDRTSLSNSVMGGGSFTGRSGGFAVETGAGE